MKLRNSLATAAFCCTSLHARADSLDVEDRTLRDERGGTIVLRGLHISGDSKVPPFRAIDRESRWDVIDDRGRVRTNI